MLILGFARSVDEMEKQIVQHTSLKVLYFYRPHVTAVSRVYQLVACPIILPMQAKYQCLWYYIISL